MDGMDVDNPGPLYARVFARAPIYDPVFGSLSPRSLIRIALTCRAAYLAVVEFKTRAYNVNRHFSRYFSDPVAFRSLQARTNTLVSGSNALQFLDRTFYAEADLDLYTHLGHSLEVVQFLVEVEGYHYVPRESQETDWRKAIRTDWDLTARRVNFRTEDGHAYPLVEIKAVWTFEKTKADEECLKVQIIEARSSPFESILGFHSTCVMNFISSDTAYSLYPVATFEHRSSLGLPTSRSSKAIQKYVKRGWRAYYVPTPNDPVFLLEQTRWVSDRYTWRLPLDQTGVQERPPLSPTSAPLTCDPVLFNGWRFMPKEDTTYGISRYSYHYYPVRSTLFRYNYAIPDEEVQLKIRLWALKQGQMCHWHGDKDDWVWFDADIPKFLERR